MKKFIICIVGLCVSLSIQSQDVIITKEGDALKVYDLEVSSTSVFYRESSGSNAPIIRRQKADLLMIKYKNGKKELFGDAIENSKGSGSQEKIQNNSIIPVEYTLEDKEANAAALKKWQEKIPDYIGKSKNKPAVILYCVLRPSAESVFADSNVEISVKSSFKEDNNLIPKIQLDEANFVITVKNKTKNTVFLDLGNSFFVRGEQSEPYYIPTAESSTTGTSSGLGVNIGPVVGIAGTSKYNTTTVYSQRVISVPPMSSKDLQAKPIIPIIREQFDVSKFWGSDILMKTRTRYANGYLYPHFGNFDTPINIGETRDFEAGDLPIKIGSFITYSFTEDIQAPRTLHSSFDIRRIIGVREYSTFLGIPSPFACTKDLTPQQLKDFFLILWQNQKD